MTVTRYGNNFYQGLTADTKPTNVPAGAIYRATDTGDIYHYNGSSWDLIVGRTKTETLTNKTLTSPVISTISNTGTLTLPTATTTLVGRDTTDTLTNKTVDSISNVVKNVESYDQVLFKVSSTYYRLVTLTGVVTSAANPDTLFQDALTAGGSVFVRDATYTFSGGFAGLDFPVNPVRCHFQMSPNAFLVVPNGYTGYVFRMVNGSGAIGCSNNTLEGGHLSEAGTPARLWTGVRLQGTGTTINLAFHNTIKKIQMNYPKIGIHLYCDGTHGAVISNYISEIIIYGADQGILFEMDGGTAYTAGQNGFYRNRFENSIIQWTSEVAADGVGVKNIMHRDNSFIGIYTVDYVGAGRATATIHADAENTIIEGGTMTALNFADNSTAKTTKIIDQTYGVMTDRLSPSNGTSFNIIPTGTTMAYSIYKSDLSERMYLQHNGVTNQINFVSVKQTAGGALRPIVVSMQDVPGGGSLVESFRIDTDSSIKIRGSKLMLRDSANDHLYTIIPSDLAADRNATLPLLTGNDEFTFNANTQTLTNKTINGLTNDVQTGPVRGKKTGGFTGTSLAQGYGLFGTMTNTGTVLGGQVDTTDGIYLKLSTAASDDAIASNKFAAFVTTRAFNPILAIKLKVGTVALNRVYAGWKASATEPSAASQDPLAATSGIMLTQRSGDTNWFICHNDGDANSTFVDTNVAVNNTSTFTIILKADNSNSKWQWSLNGLAFADITTNIPASGTGLVYMTQLQTDEAVIHDLNLYAVEVVSDK